MEPTRKTAAIPTFVAEALSHLVQPAWTEHMSGAGWIVLAAITLVFGIIVRQILCRIGQKLAPLGFVLFAVVAVGLWTDPATTTDKLLWCAQTIQVRWLKVMERIQRFEPSEKSTAYAERQQPL